MSASEDFIRPYVESVMNIFSTMLAMDPKWVGTREKTDNRVFGEVTGIMGTSEGGAEGLVVASFPKTLALRIGAGFLGMEVSELNDDVKECIRELVNMIAGGAKAKLEGTPYFFMLSIPTVVTGTNMEIHHKPGHYCVVGEMALEGEVFVIEASMKRV